MTTANNTRFNAEAAAWDSNPSVLRASELACETLRRRVLLLRQNPDVLEIGCGTGLLSLALAPHVRSITAVDAAEGMIAALQAKLDDAKAETEAGTGNAFRNVRAVHALLEDPDDERIRVDPVSGDEPAAELPPRRFDIVISHLVLHHIPDLPALFKTMLGCLRPRGLVALIDFEDFGPEARRFHPEHKMDGVERHGIRRDEVARLLTEAGFQSVNVQTAFEMEKEVETEPGSGEFGASMTFPFLLCWGKKPI